MKQIKQTKYSGSGIYLGSKDCGFEVIQQKPVWQYVITSENQKAKKLTQLMIKEKTKGCL